MSDNISQFPISIEKPKRDKRARFKRKAESAVNNILSSCNTLYGFTYASTLLYTEEDVDKIFKAIKDGIKSTENSMRSALKTHKKIGPL